MLRLTPKQLDMEMSRLWPYILTELDNLFDSKYLQKQKAGENDEIERLKLIEEGIKLVQLMSRLNIEDFYMNQWMFLFDGYGMQPGDDTRSPGEESPFGRPTLAKPTTSKLMGMDESRAQ